MHVCTGTTCAPPEGIVIRSYRLLPLILASLVPLACSSEGDSEVTGDDELTAGDVIFSPRPMKESHLARIVSEIDRATTSLDIAMYSFSDAQVSDALARAVKRGVKVRFIFNDAGDHQRAAPEAR